MSTTISRKEQLRAQIILALEQITQDNGFRSTVKAVYPRFVMEKEVPAFPSLCVILGDEKIEPEDQKWSLTNSKVNVGIVGYISVETPTDLDNPFTREQDALIQDVKRVLYTLFTQYATVALSLNNWVFDLNEAPLRIVSTPDWGQVKGSCGFNFGCIIRCQDGDF